MRFDDATEAWFERTLAELPPPTEEQLAVLRRVFGGIPGAINDTPAVPTADAA